LYMYLLLPSSDVYVSCLFKKHGRQRIGVVSE
jgi:hypothetical protein